MSTRIVTFFGPPPAEVAERCTRSAELLTEMRRYFLEVEDEGRLAYVDGKAEQLRGVITDLVLAAAWLNSAVSE